MEWASDQSGTQALGSHAAHRDDALRAYPHRPSRGRRQGRCGPSLLDVAGSSDVIASPAMFRPRVIVLGVAALFGSLLPACGDNRRDPKEVCAAYAFSPNAAVRVFAIQPKLDLPTLTSYDAYRAHLVDLVETQVRPCLATDRPNVIVFPEEMGLPAAFIGSRGAKARKQETAVAAFVNILFSYDAPATYYKQKWPDLTVGQTVGLIVTDTVWRAFYETTRDIARSTGAWVITSANISGLVEASTDPADIEALKDPDLDRVDYVYVARDPAVYNNAYVFDPQGEIVHTTRKAYLVPAEEDDLNFAYGPLRDLRPLDLGFARLGLLTSKDAWMPDVVDRLAIRGANVFVQPEAFDGLATEQVPGDWLPDVLQRSAWAAVQKHLEYRTGVIPHLTGTLLDQTLDGQSVVLTDGVPGELRQSYIGHPAQPGFLTIAPWVSDSTDRAELRAIGESLRPGGSRANEHIQTVVAADVSPAASFPQVPSGNATGTLGASTEVGPSTSGRQLRPAIASQPAQGKVAVAWEEEQDGRSRVLVTISSDDGVTFAAPMPVADTAEDQRTPSLIWAGNDLFVAWQNLSDAEGRVQLARLAGQSFVRLDVAPDDVDAWLPALSADATTPGGNTFRVCVAFAAQNEIGPQRIRVACSTDRGQTWTRSNADPSPAFGTEYHTRDNQWSPSIAVAGNTVHAGWVGFRDQNWDVYVSTSTDGGATFPAPARVDDGTDAFERIHDDVQLMVASGELLTAWSDVRQRVPRATARVRRTGQTTSSILSLDADHLFAWRPRLAAAAAGRDVFAVWQDNRTGGNDVLLAVSGDGGTTFGEPVRVDDGGDGASYQFSPQVAALSSGQLIVAWTDTRSGRPRIRYVVGRAAFSSRAPAAPGAASQRR